MKLNQLAILAFISGSSALNHKSSQAVMQYLTSSGDDVHHVLATTNQWASIKCEFDCCECVKQVSCCACPCSGNSSAKKDKSEVTKAVKAIKKNEAKKEKESAEKEKSAKLDKSLKDLEKKLTSHHEKDKKADKKKD